MYLLDTMIPSELRKSRDRRNQGVQAWNLATPVDQQYLSVGSLLELRRGALQLERKDPVQSAALHRWLDLGILPAFAGRLLTIDRAVAEGCATLQVPAARTTLDILIAATASVYGFTLVTRNTRHFQGMGLTLLNPFT